MLNGTEQIMHGIDLTTQRISGLHPSPYCPCAECEATPLEEWDREPGRVMQDLQAFTAAGLFLEEYRADAPRPLRANPKNTIYKSGHEFTEFEQRCFEGLRRFEKTFGSYVAGAWFECPECQGHGWAGTCPCCRGDGAIKASPYFNTKE
jgi:hypothetical protein